MKKRLLVLGLPRSATTYITRVIKSIGLDCRHEQQRATEAWVGWQYVVDAHYDDLHGIAADHEWEHIFHQVRHPLKVIGSGTVWGFKPVAWDWLEKHGQARLPAGTFVIPRDTAMHNWMVFWLGWNRLIEQRAEWRYRVEDIRDGTDTWAEFLGRLDIPPRACPGHPHNVNCRAHRQLTWDDLIACDAPLAGQVREMAERYGYAL